MQVCRLIELMTGESEDFALSGIFRSWSMLLKYLVYQNFARNRPCRDIAVPANFDSPTVSQYAKVDEENEAPAISRDTDKYRLIEK